MSSSTLVHLAQARPLKPVSRHGSLRWKPSSPRSKCVPRTALAGSLTSEDDATAGEQASYRRCFDFPAAHRHDTAHTCKRRKRRSSASSRRKTATESAAGSPRASATATTISTAIDANRFSAARHRAIIQTPPVCGTSRSRVGRAAVHGGRCDPGGLVDGGLSPRALVYSLAQISLIRPSSRTLRTKSQKRTAC